MSFKSTHLIFIVCLGFVELSFQDIEFFSKHIVLMFMNIKISKCLLINAIDSFQLLRLDFELNSCLSQITIKFSLEISGIDHKLIVFFGFLFERSWNRFQFDLFLINWLFEESYLFFVNINEIVLSHLQLMSMFIFQLLKLSGYFLLISWYWISF